MIDYPARYRSALLSMVRDLLDEASETGLLGDHAFYLSFRTGSPNVGLSPTLRDVYPETMTVVLQHQFWDLGTDDEGFSVTLRFGGRPESLFVPWAALTSFVDPAAEFGFELPESEPSQVEADDEAADTGPKSAPSRLGAPENADTPATAAAPGSAETPGDEATQASPGGPDEEDREPAEVVSIDRFRDARQPKDS